MLPTIMVTMGTVIGCTPSPSTPNLLIISIDTLRADHLGLYGYDRPTSPNLDALAEHSVVFDKAMTQATTTGPSHSTLLTGLYPHTHGVYRNGQPLAEHVQSLGDILKEHGYATGGFVSGLPLMDVMSGLGSRFDLYDDEIEDRRRNGTFTVDNAIAWLKEQSGSPFFMFLHLYDVHGPYEPPPELKAKFRRPQQGPYTPLVPQYQRMPVPDGKGYIQDVTYYTDLYDAGIYYADSLVGRFLMEIDFSNTVVLVVSDHGETLDERGGIAFDHGHRLFEEQTRIVGILRAPDLEPGRIDGLVGMVDFAPTLLGLMGFEEDVPDLNEGRDLRPLLLGETDRGKRAEFTTSTVANFVSKHHGFRVDEERLGTAMRLGDTDEKLLTYPTPNDSEKIFLFDLDEDPGETVDLSEEQAAKALEYLELMDRWNPRRDEAFAGEVEISDEHRKQLESLGYVF